MTKEGRGEGGVSEPPCSCFRPSRVAAPVRARLGESVAAARGPKKVRFIALMARVVFFGFFLRRPATVFSDFRCKIRCRNLDAVVSWKQARVRRIVRELLKFRHRAAASLLGYGSGYLDFSCRGKSDPPKPNSCIRTVLGM